MTGTTIQATVSGEAYIASLARYIRSHSEQLSSASASLKGAGHNDGRASWASMLYLSSQAPSPLTLTLDLYHLYYVLLKIQEAGFADVGDMDEPLRVDHHRRPALPAASLARNNDQSDTLSIKTSFSTISKGLSSIGSGWWGASTSASSVDPATALQKDLKLIYTAFTLLPSLKLIRQDPKGKSKAIEGFDFPDLPGDRMLPLKAFKSLERLELTDIDARTILFSEEWQNIVNLRVSDCGTESIGEILACCKSAKGADLTWPARLRMLDFEHNDITAIDAEETTGLERVLSLNLRKNLLLSVPTALANLTSLRALDLSDNMIDSVLSIYSSLPGLSILNLRGNRINSLCGIERLLSIEKLDVRDNDIYDASEITRLVTLPHLTDVWIGEGNPFLNEPTSHTGHGWRIRFFDSFLKAPDSVRRRNMTEVPRLDGTGPSWNEQRHLSHVTAQEQTRANENRSTRETATWPRQSQGHTRSATDGASSDANVKTVRSRRSRNFTESAAHQARSSSPPPPLPQQTSQDTIPQPAVPTKDINTKGSLPSRTVKKKHRRVVNLDGDQVQGSADTNGKGHGHQRSATPPGMGVSTDALDVNLSKGGSPHKSLSKAPRNGKSSSRALSANTFEDPAVEGLKDGQIDSGSEAEDFRRKMEKLRAEVGANNWLSVYANAVQAKQET